MMPQGVGDYCKPSGHARLRGQGGGSHFSALPAEAM